MNKSYVKPELEIIELSVEENVATGEGNIEMGGSAPEI